MNIPGLLIEYLVVGSTALLWVFPLLGINFESSAAVSIEKAAALAPALYVLGMLVDFVAFLLVSYVPSKRGSLKARVRVGIYGRLEREGYDLPSHVTGEGRHAKISLLLQQYTPELLKELELRSSRDRIARCAIVNLSVAAIVIALCTSKPFLGLLCALGAGIALGMWLAHEHSTSEYEALAYVEAQERKRRAIDGSAP